MVVGEVEGFDGDFSEGDVVWCAECGDGREQRLGDRDWGATLPRSISASTDPPATKPRSTSIERSGRIG